MRGASGIAHSFRLLRQKLAVGTGDLHRTILRLSSITAGILRGGVDTRREGSRSLHNKIAPDRMARFERAS
jgi:hypothetical protein